MDITVPDNTLTDTIIPCVYIYIYIYIYIYNRISLQITEILPPQIIQTTYPENTVTYITVPDNTVTDTIIPYTILSDIVIPDSRDITLPYNTETLLFQITNRYYLSRQYRAAALNKQYTETQLTSLK
jgi:hypothetical protein